MVAAPPWFAEMVSTHSRPKAAGYVDIQKSNGQTVSTHSRPKAAGQTFISFIV